MSRRLPFEVHEHSYVRGPRTNGPGPSKFAHAHERGDEPHEHLDTGPATYTIDKDEWYAATGMCGGGRKKFVAAPTGPQLAFLEREERTFRVVFCDAYTPEHARAGISREQFDTELACFRELVAGQGETSGSAVRRMVGSFHLTPIYEIETGEARA
jgi:hypothetical protein